MNEENVISIGTFHVSPANVESVSAKIEAALKGRLPAMPGFIEATLLTNEERTQLVVASTWQSRHKWAAAQWDEEVDRTIVDAFDDTASYDVHLFSVLVRVLGSPINEKGEKL